jgi:Rrf2 family protein
MRLELTRRADYAVRAVLELGRHSGDGPLSAAAIAARTAIPPRFAGQVMGDLVAAGLVEARIGRHGGYRLARPPAAISILDVVEAVEGDVRRLTCVLRGAPCAIDGTCDVHAVFSAAQDALLAELAGASVAATLAAAAPPTSGG